MSTQIADAYAILPKFKYLRVVDVSDALDALGRQDLCLVSPEIRPLWPGMKFWGVALTIRVVPANRHMPPLSKEEALQSHRLWFEQVGRPTFQDLVRPGTVIVTDAHGCRETGIWGSANSLSMIARGAVGIVTDGYARDTYELTSRRRRSAAVPEDARSSPAALSSPMSMCRSPAAAPWSDQAISLGPTTTG